MRTLRASRYVEADWFDSERTRVFGRGWHFIAHASQLEGPGDHVVGEAAGVPLLAVRSNDGAIRVLHNVCRHRAGPLAIEDGRGARTLRCRYHGWSYALDGRLVLATDMVPGADFDPAAICLPTARSFEWHGLVFAAVGAAPEPADWLLDVAPPASDLSRYRHVARDAYEIDCNWKVYVENYLEGYHLPHVHPELNRLLDYRHYRTALGRWHSVQSSPLGSASVPYRAGEARYVFLYPGTMLNLLPDRLQTNRVVAVAPQRCRVVFDYYAAPDVDEAAVAADRRFSDVVQREDEAICEAVQRGLASGSYEDGPLNPQREAALAHFHALLREDCANAAD
jgi:choline monooxygenase